MPFRISPLLPALLVLGFAALDAYAADPEPRPITVAIVRDGDSAALNAIDHAMRTEIEALAGTRFSVRFADAPAFNANWQPERIAAALDAALADPAIDVVLVVGAQSILAVADGARRLEKPVIGALVQEPGLVGLPIDEAGRSLKENFAIVTVATTAIEQLTFLRAAVPFTSLRVLADEFNTAGTSHLEGWRARLTNALGVPVELVPLTDRADGALAVTQNSTGVVLLLPPVRMGAAERDTLMHGLTAQRQRVIGFLGQPDVNAGALAGVLPEVRTILARHVAINLDRLVSGTPATELSLRVAVASDLFFNESVAAAIGFTADMKALAVASIADRAPTSSGNVLTLTSAVLLALEKNYDYQARQAGTSASREAVTSARGALLPQINTSQYFQQIDEDRARAWGGQENYLTTGVRVSQAVIDDETFTRLRIAREKFQQASQVEQIARFDTIQDATQSYLQLLSALASLRVTEENARVTQHNLELARLRQRVGTAGPEEGFRFESLSSQQRADLAEAQSDVDRARVALNRVLGVPVTSTWDVSDVTLQDPAFAFSIGQVAKLVNNRSQLDQFRAYLTSYALEHSPDLAAFEQDVKVQRLTADQKGRRHYMPKVSASFDVSRTLADGWVGADPDLEHRNEWTFALSASVPIFSGGSIRAEARRAKAELNQLELSRDGVRESIAAQAQAGFYAVNSAFVNIELSRQSAELAARNLAVVQEKYEQGTVSIVTLLDAQNTAFAQRQSADVAVYRLFSEIISLERTFGWFELLATPEEKTAWLAQLQAAVAAP
jgi:outer membrane protein